MSKAEENMGTVPTWAVDSNGDTLDIGKMYSDDEGSFTVLEKGLLIEDESGNFRVETWDEVKDYAETYWNGSARPQKVVTG